MGLLSYYHSDTSTNPRVLCAVVVLQHDTPCLNQRRCALMMRLLALLGCTVALPVAPQNATLKWGTEPIKVSSTGPSSTLPSFFFMAGGEEGGSMYTGYGFDGGRGKPSPMIVTTSCPEDVFDNTSPDLRVPQLPWRLQEDWGCEAIMKPNVTDVPVLVLENDLLRAAITPQWGGKVWSLYHKKLKRQLFFNNPAHQPANIGYRKAWASGGCEWNWSPGKIGHSVFTESPVWSAVLESSLGPVVRVWEFDRLNGTVWQVDVLVAGDMMYAHPKITNPTRSELPGYWWTCVAMAVTDAKTRVVTPAPMSVSGGKCHEYPRGSWTLHNMSFAGIDAGNCRTTGTCAWEQDMSFIGNIPHTNDFFFRTPPDLDPWITHVQPDGFSVLHSHPSFLNGTKFFEWGYNEYATYNEDFLSATQTDVPGCNPDAYDPWCDKMTHEGGYVELQVGPARTQMHTFPVPAESSIEWTEHFKAWQADATKMLAADYNVALHEVNDWLRSPQGIPKEDLAHVDEVLRAIADVPPTPDQILNKGMPWGGLHEMLLTKLKNEATQGETRSNTQGLGEVGPGGKGKTDGTVRLAPGCPFPAPELNDETAPWIELLKDGTFSNETLANRVPVNFEVSETWMELLSKSLMAGHETWLHYLFLGTHALEVGNADGARELLTKSMNLQPSVHGARNLAIFAKTADEAAGGYQKAWRLWLDLDPTAPNVAQLGSDLSTEISGWLLGNERWDELSAFLLELGSKPRYAPYLMKDHTLHARAALAVHNGDFATAIPILRGNCFPTYGRMRSAIIQLWHQAQLLKARASNGGRELSRSEKIALRKRFRCDGDSSEGTLDGPCVCGPPNLGYAY